ncbi:MAG TPA: hypothetical protein VF721_01895 [Pyrinomonadaceae bacterium]|jgi:hypothetical protein
MSNEEVSYFIQYEINTKKRNEDIDTIEELLQRMKYTIPSIKILVSGLAQNSSESKILMPNQYKLFRLSDFFLPANDRKNIFEPLIGDWQEELFEALENKQIWRARWINFRYTYAFFVAMWKRVSIFSLIEMNAETLQTAEVSQENIKDLFTRKGLSVENQSIKRSIKLSESERERLAKLFSSSQQLGELINEDREER